MIGDVGFAVGGEALEDAALIVEFGGHDAARVREHELWFKGPLVLAEAPCAVRIASRGEVAERAALVRHDDHGNAAAQDFREGFRRNLNAFVQQEAVEVVQWNLPQAAFIAGVRMPAVDFKSGRGEAETVSGSIEASSGHGNAVTLPRHSKLALKRTSGDIGKMIAEASGQSRTCSVWGGSWRDRRAISNPLRFSTVRR